MTMSALSLSAIADFVENEDLEDLSISTGGDFKRENLPAKNHVIRLVSYVEIGEQEKKKFQSEEKEIIDQVRIVFEVLSKDGIRTNDKGEVVGARRLVLTCKKSTHERSTLRKLFELLREGDTTITHFAQMIGVKAWKLKVDWAVKGEVIPTAKKRKEALAALEADPSNKDLRIYENWKTEGVPNISPARNPILDEDGEETDEYEELKVRPVVGKYEFFLWDQPQEAHWASLFVEGEYENKDKDGKVTKVSKNKVQEMMINAKNYDGSPLQAMLDGVEIPDGAVVDDEPQDEPEAEEPEADEPEADEDEGDNDAKQDEIDELGL